MLQDTIVNDPAQLAEIFNDFFFTTVASGIGFDDTIISSAGAIRKHKEHPSVEKIVVIVDLVMQNIKIINPKKATGYDNIPGKIIKIAYRELSAPICNLMNTCIATKTFPTPFKFADVIPIFKSDDNMNKGYFRPVSILTILSKLFEIVLNEQMLDHFHEIFDALLSACRRHYSCQTVLLKFVEGVKSALDGGHKVRTIFMDLSKAFDCLPRGPLIAKLHAYGCSMSACELISNYLSYHQQCVKILNNRSAWGTLSKGVPRVSILGPLLFNALWMMCFY